MASQDNPAAEMKLLFSDEWARKQRRQMLIALTLLLAALIVVLTKDREFWFPPAPVSQSESEPSQDISVQSDAKSEPAASTEQLPLSTRSKSKSHMEPAATAKTESAPAVAPLVTSRTVLPPLEVEVVAGDEHRKFKLAQIQSTLICSPKRDLPLYFRSQRSLRRDWTCTYFRRRRANCFSSG